METVLYEFHVNYWELLLLAVLLLAGVVVWFYPKWNPFPAKIEKIRRGKNLIARVFSVIFIVTFLLASVSYGFTYSYLKNAYKNDTCMTVRGEVQLYNGNLTSDSKTESFVIDGVYFEYSRSDLLSHGYHRIYEDGGVITGNGQELVIRYVNDGSRNIILYIGEPDGAAKGTEES